MTLRNAFTEEEWTDVVLGPMLASFALTAADPSGLLGVIRESSAAARAMDAARTDGDPLTDAVMETYDTPEGQGTVRDTIADMVRGRSPDDATADAIARISRVSRLLDRKEIDAAVYRDWLRSIGRAVAEASREGGFLGFGGEKISEQERRTLADLDAALSNGIG